MKAIAFLTFLPVLLLARPTLEEVLLADPVNGLHQEILPTPTDLPSEEGFDVSEFGDAIALHGDLAAVGAPVNRDAGEGNPGAVYLYRRGPSGWAQIQKLVPPDATERHRFGDDVAFNEDGTILVVGSNDRDTSSTGNNGVASGAYVHRLNPATGKFHFVQKLVPADNALRDLSGQGVGISGDWIVVGSPGESSGQGELTLFQWDEAAAAWQERQSFGNSFFEPLGNPGTFTIRGDVVSYFNDFSDGAVINIYRRDPLSNLWLANSSFGVAPSTAFPIQDASTAGILSHRNNSGQLALRKAAGPGGPWINIDTSTAVSAGSGTRPVLSAAINSSLIVANFGAGETVNPAPVLEFHLIGESATTPLGSADTADHGRATAIDADDHTVLFTEFIIPPVGSSYRQVSAMVANEVGLLAKARSLLFYEDADPAAPGEAAFAYQKLLYDEAAPGSFSTRHDEIETLYAQVNRDHAGEADEILHLSYPDTTGSVRDDYENLFLDLAYGRAAAELIRARNSTANLDAERLEIRTNLFLDTEITTVRTSLQHTRAGLNAYLDLLADPLGVAPDGGNPAGRALFKRQVPSRQLFPATDINGDSVAYDTTVDPPVLLDPATPLLDGYKDYVLLLDLLLQHTRTASDLVDLLTARDTPADRTEARQLIGDTQRLVFEQRSLLNALFDPADLTPVRRDELGIAQLDRGLDAALSDLTGFSQNLDGTINLLGYEPEFLMLIQNQGGLFDSYDSFESLLNDSNSPLEVAKTNRQLALDAIASYGNNQDALENEFSILVSNSEGSIGNRLTQIVGVPYSDPPTPAYQNPQDNEGSEIWQQLQSIEAANLRIRRNSAEISNLHRKIAIEQERRATEAGINATLSALIIDYGNQQASMTEEIGRIEATQKAADALSELCEVENITKLITGIGVANAAVQAGGEIGKANLQASKERLAAGQDAAIRDADDDILENNSQALVKTMFLEMNTLLIDSQEATILLRQEVGGLTGLLGEKADLERRLDEVDQELSARYFADPVHRLRAQNATELATISFRNARKWLFFAARALEYKWNTPLNLPANESSDGRAWTTADLFKLRNAHELDRFFTALDDWDDLVEQNRTYGNRDDWFSLREDYYGFKQFDDQTAAELFYDVVNPDTGLIENVNAVTAFRYSLRRSMEDCNGDGFDDICVRFDTIRQAGYDTTANGGAGGYQTNFFHPNLYLDRLDTLRIFVRGPHQFLGAVDGDNTITARLAYLGTSVIRNQSPGLPINPLRPDRVANEFTSYPNRFYRFVPRPIGDPLDSGYAYTEGLSANTAEALKILPGRSRSLLEPLADPVPITSFRERSVATSSWTLVLFPSSGINSNTRLVIDEMDDIELYILHRAVDR
ncbi:FG-GAP repeat protein [Luteolibacter marinus]|uniref:FG-GAP repeat protein n=1 Tax=Luteolibacter marinus TaxID=2776705 RepID=UPI0018671B68|nr:FG-GAP repeat protein [Luteolibacter marinus]